jgi:hypothetical protein
VKTALRQRGFRILEDIKENMTAELDAVALEVFAGCFQKLLKRFSNLFLFSHQYGNFIADPCICEK